MPRRAVVKRNEVQPDSKFNNLMISRLVNKVMIGGKKTTAQRVVYDALDIIGEREGKEPVAVMELALRN
ncbi:MAG: 30S ribosomal protein S7, partial [Dehalococcoidales bacterium]|nr:30S ribosomal protein S7 [Dehalococcoidales bacterium]